MKKIDLRSAEEHTSGRVYLVPTILLGLALVLSMLFSQKVEAAASLVCGFDYNNKNYEWLRGDANTYFDFINDKGQAVASRPSIENFPAIDFYDVGAVVGRRVVSETPFGNDYEAYINIIPYGMTNDGEVLGYIVLANDFPPGFETFNGATFFEFSTIFSFVWDQEQGFRDINDEVAGISGQNDIGLSTSLGRDAELVGSDIISKETHHLLTTDNRVSQGRPLGQYETPLPWQVRNSEKNIPVAMLNSIRSQCNSSPVGESEQVRFLTEAGYGDSNDRLEFVVGQDWVRRAVPNVIVTTSHFWVDNSLDNPEFFRDNEGLITEDLGIQFHVENIGSIDAYDLKAEVEYLSGGEIFSQLFIDPAPTTLLSGDRSEELTAYLEPVSPGATSLRIKVTGVDEDGFGFETTSRNHFFTVVGDVPTRLSGTLRFTDNRENGNVNLGDEFSLTLDVKTDDGDGGIDNISIDTNFANAENLTIVSSPSIPQGFRMEPETERSFEWKVRGEAGGKWRIVSNISGVNSFGVATKDTAIKEGAILGNELTAEITLDPEQFEPQEEEPGKAPVPVEFNATLKVCNTTKGPLENVTVRQFRAIPAYIQPFYVTLIEGPVIDTITGLRIGVDGKLAKESCVEVRQKYKAEDDNDIEVDALVDGESAAGTRISATAETSISIDPRFFLSLKLDVLRPFAGEPLLPAGQTIRIGGTVRNLSNIHKLEIGPLYPELSGNAGAQSLTWDSTGADPDQFPQPDYPLKLDPGESKDFHVRIVTLSSDPRHYGDSRQNGGTRAYAKFTPWGRAIANDGTETIFKEDKVKINRDLTVEISIDDSVPIPETDYLALGGGLMIGTAQAAYEWSAGLVYGVVELVQLPATVLWGAYSYQSEVWDSFTEEEKEAFAKDAGYLAASVLLRNAELAKQDFSDLWDGANKAVYNSMTEMANEWELGNHSDVARVYAKYGGQAIAEVAVPMAMAKIAKEAKAATTLKRAQDAKNARNSGLLRSVDEVTSIERAENVLFNVESGVHADATRLKNVMGYLPEETEWISRTCREFRILCTARSRAVESMTWVKKFAAKLKPEPLKLKSVSPLDEILGYPKIYNGESSVGALVFKKPDALVIFEQSGGYFDEIVKNFVTSKGIKPGDANFEEAVRRVKLRKDEWVEFEKSYKQWNDRGWIDTTFTNEFNAVNKETWWDVNPNFKKQGAGKYEGFRMRPLHPDGSPSEAFVIELFDPKTGKWRPVTGDIDFLAFTHRDGTSLSAGYHAKVLKAFSEGPIGIRHGESATGLPGDTGGGTPFIQKQLQPGEAAVQFGGPDGAPARFVRLDEKKTIWEGPGLYKLNWEGGFKYVGEFITNNDKNFIESLSPPKVSVDAPPGKTSAVPAPAPDGGPNVGRCDIRTTADPAAPAVAMGKDGRLITVDETGNVTPSDLHDTCFSEEPGIVIVGISPGSALRSEDDGAGPAVIFERALSGENTLILYEDGTVPVSGRYGGLEVGQKILIGVELATAEIREILSINPLQLDQPLDFDHGDGEVIVVVEPSPRQLLVEVDTDADGVRDIEDFFPNDPNETTDNDWDGIGDTMDLDDDNDGVSDLDEIKFLSDPLDPQDGPAEHRPDQPSITAVGVVNAAAHEKRLTLALTDFADPDVGDSLDSVEITIQGPLDYLVEGDVLQRVLASSEGATPRSLSVPVSALDPSTTYRLLVKYQDATGLISLASDVVVFQTLDSTVVDVNNNGVPDTIEPAPGGDFDNNGESDSEQGLLVITSASGNSTFGLSADVGVIDNVVALTSEEAVSTVNGATLDDGLVSFRIDSTEPGATAEISLLYDQPLSADQSLVQYDPVAGYTLLQTAVFSESSVVVTITDGSDDDLDGVSNGRIVATLARGQVSDEITNPGTTEGGSSGGGGGCTLSRDPGRFDPLLLLLVLSSIFACLRHCSRRG